MREHAIPQDVVGYKFHIVGNMTLKQFLEVGAGCVVGFLIYSTNLYDLIKWPLVSIAVGIGVLAAFVPFEERPLDHWLVTFISILYKPTKFFWRKDPKVPDPFLFTPNQQTNTQTELDLSPYRRQRAREFLVSVQPPKELDSFEVAELNRISGILSTFDNITVAEVQAIKQPSMATLKLTQHSLRSTGDVVEETNVEMSVVTPTSTLQPLTSATLQNPEPLLAMNQGLNPTLNPNQVAQDIAIPKVEEITIARTQANEESQSATTVTPQASQAIYSTTAAELTQVSASEQAAYNTQLPFPHPPTEPNKVVGMVLTPQNDLVSDAIIEIKTTAGATARAVKTNALGQFFVSTALPNGEYVIEVDKEGISTTPIALSLTGSAVPPIEIRTLA